MINGSIAFNEAVLAGGYPYTARISENGTIIDCNVISCNVFKGTTGNEAFSVGTIFVPYIEMEVSDLSVSLEDKELKLEFGVQISPTTTEWISIGIFKVWKINSSTIKTSFTALGRIALVLPTVIIQTLETPTIASAITAIQSAMRSAGYTNFTISALNVATTGGSLGQSFSAISCRDLLEIITNCVGCYATEDNNGNVVLFKYNTNSTIEYTGNRMVQHPVVYDSDFELENIKVIQAESYINDEGIEVPEVAYVSGVPYNWVVSNPYMISQSMFDVFASNCVGLTFRPANIMLAYGDPRLEAQDVLKIVDTDGSIYIVPCMSITHTLTGGLTSLIISTGQTESEAIAGTKGPITQQIDKMNSNLLSVEVSAKSAKESAETAASAAAEAQTAADLAASSAEQALSDAADAAQAATNAQGSANIANAAANNALTQLSTIEDVIGTLNWISEHGTYKVSTDTVVVAGKYYFSRSGSGTSSDPYVYTVITNPTGNPSTQGYYELDSVDEAVSNYIGTHLSLTSQGLWVTGESTSYKILLASDGMKVYDAQGNLVTTFGESITFSSSRAQYIGGEDAYIIFYDSDNDNIPDAIRIGGTNIQFGSQTMSQVLADIASAKDTAEGTLIYDHTYTVTNNVATFTAYVYRGGVDIKTLFSPEQFTWYLKTEDGTDYLGYGYTTTVSTTDCGYGAEVIGKFTISDDSEALTADESNLTDNSGSNYTVRASGDAVRVRELTTVTTVYSTEKLMVVGTENEHLITMDTLYAFLLNKLSTDDNILYCGTASEVV